MLNLKSKILISKYNFEEKIRKSLFNDLKNTFEIKEISDSYCGKSKEVFFKTIRTNLIKHRDIMK